MTRELPILFSPAMIRVLPPGPKRQTRRTRGLGEINESPDDWTLEEFSPEWATLYNGSTGEIRSIRCPYGPAGTLLWVKEGWRPQPINIDGDGFMRVRYLADRLEALIPHWDIPADWKMPQTATRMGGVTSLFMPRWASRKTLVNTGWRLERVQDITEEDAAAEGVPPLDTDGQGMAPEWCYECRGTQFRMLGGDEVDCKYCDTLVKRFRNYWDHLNGKKLPWVRNPYCWVISFEEAGPENVIPMADDRPAGEREGF